MSTIVALSTPPGRSAIALIRLSGPATLRLIGNLIQEIPPALSPRHSVVKTIHDPNQRDVIDRSVITYMQAPNSFTGEDMAEISCHGSPVIVRRIIDLVVQGGARLAGPGEFTLRALGNGKMDLSQAEAIRDLINAQTEAASRQAIRQLNGELSATLQPLKSQLVDVIVRLESAIEFVEDDLPAVQTDQLAISLREIILGLSSLAATYEAGHWIRDGVRVTIAGRPNVGKSSLFNGLLKRDRAIVTEIPGTTRDTLSESINLGGLPVWLTDTAGIRETVDTVERFGVDRAQRAISDADLVLFVFDGTVGLTDEDVRLLCHDRDSRYLVVANKSDLPTFASSNEREGECVSISALRGDGLDHLCELLVNRFVGADGSGEGFLVTDARHFDLLNRSAEQLTTALRLLESRTSEEVVLVGLHNGLTLLGAVTGETTTEDILTQIFSTFCIGK